MKAKLLSLILALLLCANVIAMTSCDIGDLFLDQDAQMNEGEETAPPFNLIFEFDESVQGYKVVGYQGTAISVEIPEVYEGYPVTSIGEYAFHEGGFASITIPNSITSIDPHAFVKCGGLISITLPDSLTSINDYTFDDCSGLTSVTIPNSVTSIGTGAFNNCCNLTSVTIPDSVTSIGDYAFTGCQFTSVKISENVTYIGEKAFELCNIEAIEVPSFAIPYFGDSKVKTVVITSGNQIDSNAFKHYFELTNVIISNTVTSIGNYAFEHCNKLTSITIPDSVTSIGNYAFDTCASLTSITIPDSVTSIGNHAFENCTSLASVTISDGVTTIGDHAFHGCYSLTSVIFENPIGWSTDSVELSPTALENPPTAATYLTSHDYYLTETWTRS